MIFRILMTLLVLAVVGWMVADQLRIQQMTSAKWGIAAVLAAVLVSNTWMGGLP